MKGTPASMAGLAAVALLLLASFCAAQVPHQMNYQVMLTDDFDEPLADQSVELVFRIYDVDAGGSSLWNETHNVVTNNVGVASVILGSLSPMSLLFDTPLWLQVEVDGQTMAPRRPLTAAPYALTARNADFLGGDPAEDYALGDDLSQTGQLNNPGNPLEWTRLKNVPAGFADGVDNAGLGDGSSLDASDGSPTDVVWVDADGRTLIGTGAHAAAANTELRVTGIDGRCAAVFDGTNSSSSFPTFLVRGFDTSGIAVNANSGGGYMTPTNPTAVYGYAFGDGTGGAFRSESDGDGVHCSSGGTGSALRAHNRGTGYSGYFEGGSGVYMERTSGYPALTVLNLRESSIADAAWFSSESGVSSATWTLFSDCYEGIAGKFVKRTDDNEYAAEILGVDTDSEGLFVRGTIYSTTPLAYGIETSRGTEPVFGVSSPDVELMASGQGRLSAGKAHVDFGMGFSSSVADAQDLRVTVTPIESWSAVYVSNISDGGFDVRSEAGDLDVEFHWVAVGRALGYEERPRMTIPDPEEDAGVTAAKLAEVESSKPPQERSGPDCVFTRTAP